jgi:hypothetical protein
MHGRDVWEPFPPICLGILSGFFLCSFLLNILYAFLVSHVHYLSQSSHPSGL